MTARVREKDSQPAQRTFVVPLARSRKCAAAGCAGAPRRGGFARQRTPCGARRLSEMRALWNASARVRARVRFVIILAWRVRVRAPRICATCACELYQWSDGRRRRCVGFLCGAPIKCSGCSGCTGGTFRRLSTHARTVGRTDGRYGRDGPDGPDGRQRQQQVTRCVSVIRSVYGGIHNNIMHTHTS